MHTTSRSTGHLLYAQYFKCPPKSGKYQDDGSCCPFLFLFKAKKEVGHYLYTVYILKIHFWIINDLIIKINLLFKGFSEIFKSSFRWNSFLKLVHESFCLERNEQLSLPWKHCCGLTKRSSVPFQSGRCWCLYQTVVMWYDFWSIMGIMTEFDV